MYTLPIDSAAGRARMTAVRQGLLMRRSLPAYVLARGGKGHSAVPRNSDKGAPMSYQSTQHNTRVIVCDICQASGPATDHRWRPTRHSTTERPMHLCPSCWRVAVWCPAHQAYHLPDAFHRRACADCGGLFTSVVREEITRCPACRRAAGGLPARQASAPAKQPRTWMRAFFTARGSERH